MYQKTAAPRRYLGFVIGHNRPAIVEVGARYWRAHADGTPMVADSADDTLDACQARHAKASRPPASMAKGKAKGGDAD